VALLPGWFPDARSPTVGDGGRKPEPRFLNEVARYLTGQGLQFFGSGEVRCLALNIEERQGRSLLVLRR
jgi:hypothetical protein